MPRKGKVRKRELLPDPVYHSVLVTQFVNQIMEDGKKSVAEGIFYGALDLVAEKQKKNPIEVFHTAIDNVKPELEVKSRRVGGATYQVPVEVPEDRQKSLAMRWILTASRARSDGRSMKEKLARELMDASAKQGSSIKKKEDTHKMAEANRAFAHYRW